MNNQIPIVVLAFLIVIGVLAASVMGSRMRKSLYQHLFDDLARLRGEVADLRAEVEKLRDRPANAPVSDGITKLK